jgi:hypothetical protein
MEKIISFLVRLFSKATFEQVRVIICNGDDSYPSVLLWKYWESYVGADYKTYYNNKKILKNYLLTNKIK